MGHSTHSHTQHTSNNISKIPFYLLYMPYTHTPLIYYSISSVIVIRAPDANWNPQYGNNVEWHKNEKLNELFSRRGCSWIFALIYHHYLIVYHNFFFCAIQMGGWMFVWLYMWIWYDKWVYFRMAWVYGKFRKFCSINSKIIAAILTGFCNWISHKISNSIFTWKIG